MALVVEIVSPSKPVLKAQEAFSIVVPGRMGYMEILSGHAPMVSELGIGGLFIKVGADKVQNYFVSGGYIEVNSDKVEVLADVVLEQAQIDIEKAKQDKVSLTESLLTADGEFEVSQLLIGIKDADARLEFMRAVNIGQS